MIVFEWNKKPRGVSLARLKRAVAAFASAAKIKRNLYFSLAFVDAKTIKKINRLYRRQNQETDVLSFAESEARSPDFFVDKKYLGEIIIGVGRAKSQARDFGLTFSDEVARLLVHGLAHLFGYEHEGVSSVKKNKMVLLEKRTMNSLGLKNIQY